MASFARFLRVISCGIPTAVRQAMGGQLVRQHSCCAATLTDFAEKTMHTLFTRDARGDDARCRVATTLRIAAAAVTLLISLGCSDTTPPDESGTFFGPTVAM